MFKEIDNIIVVCNKFYPKYWEDLLIEYEIENKYLNQFLQAFKTIEFMECLKKINEEK